MLASQLQRLSAAADVTRLNAIGLPPSLTLYSNQAGLNAWVSGQHAAAGITVQTDTVLPVPVSLGPSEFKELVGLFDPSTEVALRVDESKLTIASRARRVSLRYYGVADTSNYDALRQSEPIAQVPLADLIREITFAAGVASVSMAVPILQGMLVVMHGPTIGIQAANGSSLVFQVATPAQSYVAQSLVAPVQDTLLAARILGDEPVVTIKLLKRTLVLEVPSGAVKVPLLIGEWPNMSQLAALQFVEKLTVSVATIKALLAAARAYKTSSEAIISPTANGVLLSTTESEQGQFQELLPAEAGMVSRRYTIDVGDLDSAARMSSDYVELEFSNTMARVTVESRRLYINLRASL